MKRKSAWIPLLLLFAALPMCGGSSGGGVPTPTAPSPVDAASPGPAPAPTSGPAQSMLRVNLTDKPTGDYLAVNVTVVAVRVHQSGSAGEMDGGWVELPVTAAMPVDMLTLQGGVLYALCQAQLPAGHYQQIRMELAPNTGSAPPFAQSVLTADTAVHALDVPSGTLKIAGEFTVDAAAPTELTLDFDASQSVKSRGNGTYFMTPVIMSQSSMMH